MAITIVATNWQGPTDASLDSLISKSKPVSPFPCSAVDHEYIRAGATDMITFECDQRERISAVHRGNTATKVSRIDKTLSAALKGMPTTVYPISFSHDLRFAYIPARPLEHSTDKLVDVRSHQRLTLPWEDQDIVWSSDPSLFYEWEWDNQTGRLTITGYSILSTLELNKQSSKVIVTPQREYPLGIYLRGDKWIVVSTSFRDMRNPRLITVITSPVSGLEADTTKTFELERDDTVDGLDLNLQGTRLAFSIARDLYRPWFDRMLGRNGSYGRRVTLVTCSLELEGWQPIGTLLHHNSHPIVADPVGWDNIEIIGWDAAGSSIYFTANKALCAVPAK